MQIMSLYIFVNDGVRNSTKLMEREDTKEECWLTKLWAGGGCPATLPHSALRAVLQPQLRLL